MLLPIASSMATGSDWLKLQFSGVVKGGFFHSFTGEKHLVDDMSRGTLRKGKEIRIS